MIITYFGKEFFKIAQGETVIAVNPISKESKYTGKIARFGSSIMLSTTNHSDYNGLETVTYGEQVPVSITGPGDYEIMEIFIKGTNTRTTLDSKEYINSPYSISMDGITIAFLGPLSKPLSAEERDGLESPDILFVPVSSNLLSPAAAYKLAVSLEPAIIIPMDYSDAELKLFLKEAGVEKASPLDKLVLKKKDLENKEAEVVVLETTQ